MRADILAALRSDRTIDITTRGRKSGKLRRIEIWFHNIDDEIYITGRPGRRDWYANLLADPALTFHIKESLKADLPARAMPITDPDARRTILARIASNLERDVETIDEWVTDSPLVCITFGAQES